MKRSAIELDQITDESEEIHRKHTPGAKPKLSYKAAMASYFIDQAGEICQVRTCSAATFYAFAQASVSLAKRPDLAAGDIAGLNFSERIDRWFCLDVLRSRGAKLPLFASAEDATQSLSIQPVNSSV